MIYKNDQDRQDKNIFIKNNYELFIKDLVFLLFIIKMIDFTLHKTAKVASGA